QGLPDIVSFDSLTRVLSGIQARATFNLRNQVPGFRDVLIINGLDTTFIANGFEVQQGGKAEVWADIIVPEFMRVPPSATKPLSYTLMVSYGNNGNIDAEGVPIWIAIDTSVKVISFEFQWIPQVPGAGNPADTTLTAILTDSLFGEAIPLNVYIAVIPRVPAGFQGYLALKTTNTRTGTVYFDAWASEPLYGSPLKYAIGECKDFLAGKILGLIPGGGCLYNGLDALLSPMFDALYDPNFGSASWAANYSLTLANALVDCGLALSGAGLAVDMLKILLQVANTASDFNNIFTNCAQLFPNPKPTPNSSNILGSVDPNQKSGPGGAGPQHWISDKLPMPYLVEFENVDTATAPALNVVVLDTLDVSVYDLNSLQLNYFQIADSLFPIPRGRSEWSAWVDLRPRISTLVRVEARLDSNVLRWEFESLDPATLNPQTGISDGFLPPNINDPEGRGSFSYSIGRTDGLPTFTTLSNRAAIYFDSNPPIITNTWRNILDVDAPVSQMAALDTLQLTTAIPLSWQGSDFGSGIRYYDVYVSKNGEAYELAASTVRDTSIVYGGEWGYRYEFYTVAV
ncbi:MAG: hypothetical protein EAZ89_03595, partial [Bacteroidetes bacterium]